MDFFQQQFTHCFLIKLFKCRCNGRSVSCSVSAYLPHTRVCLGSSLCQVSSKHQYQHLMNLHKLKLNYWFLNITYTEEMPFETINMCKSIMTSYMCRSAFLNLNVLKFDLFFNSYEIVITVTDHENSFNNLTHHQVKLKRFSMNLSRMSLARLFNFIQSIFFFSNFPKYLPEISFD